MLGNRVKDRRLALGITQTELADRLNLKNKTSVCRIEKGIDKNLTTERVEKLANALCTSVAYLLEITDDPTPCPLLDEQEILHGRRDGEILRIVSQLNDHNAMLIKQFATTLLQTQGNE